MPERVAFLLSWMSAVMTMAVTMINMSTPIIISTIAITSSIVFSHTSSVVI